MKQIRNLTGHIPSIYGWDHRILPQSLIDYSYNQQLIDHSN
jgi:hypothetical protein